MSGESQRQQGRVIYAGVVRGEALCTTEPFSFYGGFDLDTGVVTDAEHPLVGQSVSGRVLVFPTGKGSTVGSYALLRLARGGVGPAALVMESCDTTVAVGAIIAEIPCVDQIDLSSFRSGEVVMIDKEGGVRVE